MTIRTIETVTIRSYAWLLTVLVLGQLKIQYFKRNITLICRNKLSPWPYFGEKFELLVRGSPVRGVLEVQNFRCGVLPRSCLQFVLALQEATMSAKRRLFFFSFLLASSGDRHFLAFFFIQLSSHNMCRESSGATTVDKEVVLMSAAGADFVLSSPAAFRSAAFFAMREQNLEFRLRTD